MIEVINLTKKYGSHLAVADLNCSIENGKIYGFLGPNGAGKSTTMNIMTGCLSATSGQVLINGHDIFEQPEQAKRRIGYLPELPPLYLDMTPREYLDFVARAKRIAKKDLPSQINQVIDLTSIQPVADRLIKNLSKGYRQRVGVAQALLGDPEILIFDEPTVGLDPKQIIEIRSLIKKLGRKHTVILSSHILSEVSAVCDEILIMSHGRLVANDTPDNLENLFSSSSTITILAKGEENRVRGAISKVRGVEKVRCERWAEGQVQATITAPGDLDLREALFMSFADDRLPILEMRREHLSLEDVFLELTSGDSELAGRTLAQKKAQAPEKAKEVNG